jgi:hypothetical protein
MGRAYWNREVGFKIVKWIQLAQKRILVTNLSEHGNELWDYLKAGNFLTGWATVTFHERLVSWLYLTLRYVVLLLCSNIQRHIQKPLWSNSTKLNTMSLVYLCPVRIHVGCTCIYLQCSTKMNTCSSGAHTCTNTILVMILHILLNLMFIYPRHVTYKTKISEVGFASDRYERKLNYFDSFQRRPCCRKLFLLTS